MTQAHPHNRILAELSYRSEAGTLDYQGVRYLLIRPETLAALRQGAEEALGVNEAAAILYAAGFTGGRLSAQKYRQLFALSAEEAVATMCAMGGEIGWGRFRLVALDPAAPRLVVEVDGSPFAEPSANTAGQRGQGEGRPGACHLIRGVLGGLMSGLFDVGVDASETACRRYNSDCCRFEISGATISKGENLEPGSN